MPSRSPPLSTAAQNLALCPLFIGRSAPLEVLNELLQSARNQRGQTLLIGGEAGIGKTRLVAEARTLAAAQEFLVLQGACFAPDQQLPFAPLLDLARNFIATQSPQALAASLDAAAPELFKLLPELANHVSPRALPPSPEPELEKKRLFQALLQFIIEGQNQDAPRLLVVEDLHWCDDASLEFLLYLARRIQAHPALLILTYRSEETSARLYRFLAEVDRGRLAAEISLSALSRMEVDAMIRAIFDLKQPVRAEFLERIYALTEGNPFFLEEILKSMIATGEIFYANGQWDRKPLRELNIPRSVQDAVQRRIEQLSEPAPHVLALAAVVGRRFDFALLQGLTGMSEPELLPLLKELLGAQLVVEESADEFAFRHALTRESVYTTLLRRERKQMHRRVAETLEQQDAGALESHVGDLAYHYHAAEIWDKALEYARRAGEKAQSMYAPREAIEQFTRALEAAQQLPQANPTTIYRARGQAYETIGDFDNAYSDYEQELHAAHAAHDARGEWQGLIDLGFLWASRDYARTDEYFQRALELARAMQDPTTVARSLNRVGNWYMNLDQPWDALSHHQEALAIFQELDDRHGTAETLDLLGIATEVTGDNVRASGYFAQAIPLWRELDDRMGLASSLTEFASLGEMHMSSTLVPAPLTFSEIETHLQDAIQIARAIGWRAQEVYAQALWSLALGYHGDYARALELARTSLRAVEEIEHQQWLCFVHILHGWLYLDLLVLDEAQTQLERALSRAHQIRSTLFVKISSDALAACLILRNELDRAQAVLDAARGESEILTRGFGERLLSVVYADLALARNDPTQALQIVEELIATTLNRTPETVIPRLWKLRGEALTRLKRFDEAETALRGARDTAAARATRPLLWRIQLALGKLYQQQDRRKEADAEYATARRVVEEIGAGLTDAGLRETFLAGANELLPRPRPRTARRAEKERFGGLTAREREIAALIAEGKSNREIADRLVLSERTVITHVTSILNKLSFVSRTQIAVWANESGLAPPR